MGLKQRIWKSWLAAKFQLFERRRYRHLVLEQVAGLPFVVLPEVFNPGLFPTGELLAKQYAVMIPKEAAVLDMGTGSGIGAVFAAQYARHVTALDINPEAVRCAQINALLNHVEDRITARQSDLFEAVAGEQFDVILFNPPFFRGTPQDAEDHAWRGVNVIERFAAELPRHLTIEGYALVIISSSGDLPGFVRACEASQLKVKILAEHDMISEKFVIYQLAPSMAAVSKSMMVEEVR
ncbi:MAG TPA: HemK2/MTQ2 family protein methyltransferase [Phototrophicaceae bacterium]|jgi:release factor glutamine methyltransferase|nr:HemK2/MTQ2 family protein methyltransferase [Phototrophicaceae bacterium]